MWITGRNPDLPVVLSFGEDDGDHYPGSFFQPHVISKLDPVSWWKNLKRAMKAQEIKALADVMIHLLSSQASSASVESSQVLDLCIQNSEIVLALSVQQNCFLLSYALWECERRQILNCLTLTEWSE